MHSPALEPVTDHLVDPLAGVVGAGAAVRRAVVPHLVAVDGPELALGVAGQPGSVEGGARGVGVPNVHIVGMQIRQPRAAAQEP